MQGDGHCKNAEAIPEFLTLFGKIPDSFGMLD
jgi:hypothetical protein